MYCIDDSKLEEDHSFDLKRSRGLPGTSKTQTCSIILILPGLLKLMIFFNPYTIFSNSTTGSQISFHLKF